MHMHISTESECYTISLGCPFNTEWYINLKDSWRSVHRIQFLKPIISQIQRSWWCEWKFLWAGIMPKESLNPKNGSCEPTPKQLSAVLNMLFVDSVVSGENKAISPGCIHIVFWVYHVLNHNEFIMSWIIKKHHDLRHDKVRKQLSNVPL